MNFILAPTSARPLVCVETVALAHGIRPEKRAAILARARAVTAASGGELAWLAMDEGVVDPFISDLRLLELLERENFGKISSRDLAVAHALRRTGGLTVSASLAVAHRLGASLVVTGAIGGVHRTEGGAWDVSADLIELGRTPVILVSAGIKPIVDAAMTLEMLESYGVPTVGLGHTAASFLYGNESPASLSAQLPDAPSVAAAFAAQRQLKTLAGFLLSTRVPNDTALSYDQVMAWADVARQASKEANIAGAGQTPFLVKHMRALGDPHLTAANEASFLNNIAVAASLSAIVHASR